MKVYIYFSEKGNYTHTVEPRFSEPAETSSAFIYFYDFCAENLSSEIKFLKAL